MLRKCLRCGAVLETGAKAADHVSDCYDVVHELTVEVSENA